MNSYNKAEKGGMKYWRRDTKFLIKTIREDIIEKVTLEYRLQGNKKMNHE